MRRKKKQDKSNEILEEQIFNHDKPELDKIGGCIIKFNEFTKFIEEEIIDKIGSMPIELNKKIADTKNWLNHIKFYEAANTINAGLYFVDKLEKMHKELIDLYNKCFVDIQKALNDIKTMSKDSNKD